MRVRDQALVVCGGLVILAGAALGPRAQAQSAAEPDTVLVLAFPDATAIDGFLRDPARADFEELAGQAITRSLITDGRTRIDPDEPATLHELRPDQP